jgi:hypothetical protein
MFWCNDHHQGAHYSVLLKLNRILRSLYADICWSCFNVNFKIVFKTIQLCVSW